MTISSTTRVAGPYSGTGLQTVFSFGFKVFQTSDILVILTDTSGNLTTQTLTSQYSVALNANQSTAPGGTVTMVTAPPSGYTLTIGSQVPATQPADLTNAGNFYPQVVNDALDRLTILQQQNLASTASTLRVPEITGVALLPAAALRAGLLMGFDGSGNPAAVSGPIASSPVVATAKRELQTATASQTVFTLATMSYASATPGSILVIVNGAVQATTAYTQTSPTVVTFASGVALNAKVEFIAGNFTSLSSGSFAASHTPSVPNNGVSFDFLRNVGYAGGTAGYVDACGRFTTYVTNPGATNFEWSLMAIMHSYATGGENVGFYAQGNKHASGPVWGATVEIIDWNGANPTSSTVGLEVDVSANGTDNSNSRIGLDLVYRRQGHVGTAMECAFGLRFNSDDSDVTQALLKTAIGFTSGAHVGIGIDFSAATIFGAAAKLGYGQVFQWGNGLGAAARQFTYLGTSLVMQDASGSNPALWAWNDNGTLFAQGKQLLSANAQQTGWVVMTGTRDHTTAFPVASATATQIASRVAAIEDLLIQHGLSHT